MCRWPAIAGLPLLVLIAWSAARGADGDPLAPGKDLPGTFHPYNVNTSVSITEDTGKAKGEAAPYSTKHKFHCLITEYDLDPVVMLFARGVEDNAAVRDLLTKLDAAIDRNRRFVRLRTFVVFLFEDLTDAVAQDEKRDAYASRLEKLAEDLKLRHVVVSLAGSADLPSYRLPAEPGLTAVLYHKLRIVATHRVPADKLTGADSPALKAILADVASKLGASR